MDDMKFPPLAFFAVPAAWGTIRNPHGRCQQHHPQQGQNGPLTARLATEQTLVADYKRCWLL
jgi:hypothetical protein